MKLYLDVDGVINFNTDEEWKDVRWERAGNGFNMSVSNKQMTRLIQLCAINNIEIVWATSWIVHDWCETYLVPLYGFPANLRKIDYYTPSTLSMIYPARGHCGKLPGVEQDAGEDEPIIWIDDCLGGEDITWAHGRKGKALLLRPNERVGLTEAGFKEIEKFIKEVQTDERSKQTTGDTSGDATSDVKRIEIVRDGKTRF